MPVKFTEYQRPDPDIEYEELPRVVVRPGAPKAPEVECCTCTGSPLCSAENSFGAQSTYYLGGAAAYVIG